MGDDKAAEDKYNVEAADIIANEAQVSYWYTNLVTLLNTIPLFLFDEGYWILQICMRFCLSL